MYSARLTLSCHLQANTAADRAVSSTSSAFLEGGWTEIDGGTASAVQFLLKVVIDLRGAVPPNAPKKWLRQYPIDLGPTLQSGTDQRRLASPMDTAKSRGVLVAVSHSVLGGVLGPSGFFPRCTLVPNIVHLGAFSWPGNGSLSKSPFTEALAGRRFPGRPQFPACPFTRAAILGVGAVRRKKKQHMSNRKTFFFRGNSPFDRNWDRS